MDLFALAIHVINIALLLGLLFVYVQNYRRLKSKTTAGLVVFVLIFLAHSVLGLFFDSYMAMYYSTAAEKAALVLEGIKAVSFAVLLWISWE